MISMGKGLARQKKTFTNKRTMTGSIYKLPTVLFVEGIKVSPYHSYVLSENGELVKVTDEGFEYTGMFLMD